MNIKFKLVILVLFISFTVKSSPYISNQIDWKDFLSRHDLVWNQVPTGYFDSPFVGNGLLGAKLYKPVGGLLRLDIGSSEVVERRDTEANSLVDNGRLPVGYFELASNYDIQAGKGRLDLYDAETQFTMQMHKGYSLDINMKVLRHKDVIVMDYTPSDTLECFWMFRPLPSAVPLIGYLNPPIHVVALNPQPTEQKIDGVNVVIQKRGDTGAGGCYVTAWKEIELANNKRRLLVTIQDSHEDDSAITDAVELIQQTANKEEFKAQEKAHKEWWNNYYTASFISIPHPQMESLYWGLQYRLASMMRKGAPLCDLMGPWYKSSHWPGVWWNLNTQMLFSSLHVSNQLELTSTLTDYVFENKQNFINSIPEEFRHNSAGLVRHCGRNQIDHVYTWPNAEFPERSNLIYLMHTMWEHYRVTMDDVYLEKQYYPLLKRAVNFLLNVVTVDSNGMIHMPKSHSPESTNDTDTNYDLSSLRWGCQTLLSINSRCGLKDKDSKIWKNTLKNLRPYPTDENGYMCSANIKAPLKHRHWCHLFQIYPYHLVNFDQPESHDVILKSLSHWGDSTIPNTWTQAVISSIYSSMQDGEAALKHLNAALKTSNLSKNMTHSEGKQPCSETYGGLSRMLQDMLMQSWGDKIRIFPAVSEEWDEAVFEDLRAEGGFLVSASRKDGATNWIQVESLAGEPCIIEHNFKEPFKVKGAKFQRIDDKTCRIKIEKGRIAILYTGEFKKKIVEPIIVLDGDYNYYGIN